MFNLGLFSMINNSFCLIKIYFNLWTEKFKTDVFDINKKLKNQRKLKKNARIISKLYFIEHKEKIFFTGNFF